MFSIFTMEVQNLLSSIITNDDVYMPLEDSELLLKSIKEVSGLIKPDHKILDMCCGTGVQGVYASQFSKNITFVDISELAIKTCKQNCKKFKLINPKIVHSDLFDNINSKFDWIIINPPYLPTDDTSKVNGKLNLALDGGVKGRDLIDKFIAVCGEYLNQNGRVLLLDSSLNDTSETLAQFECNGFKYKIINSQNLFFEKLNSILFNK